jgi:cell wall-associated NlpC family hydrolase
MIYRAVGNRCAVSFSDLYLEISTARAKEILVSKGYEAIEVDIIALARSVVGKAEYRRGARLAEAPHIFDCSSLVKWLYGQRGILLPRRSIQMRECGDSVNPCDVQAGDIVLVSGRIDYYVIDQSDGVGHVGIATNDGTVIEAANRQRGIIETPFDEFIGKKGLRDIRRIIPARDETITYITPPEREIESSDDLKWIILQNI